MHIDDCKCEKECDCNENEKSMLYRKPISELTEEEKEILDRYQKKQEKCCDCETSEND